MKSFESFLATKMTEYIQYRHALGYTFKDLKSCLLHLDRYLTKINADWDSLWPAFFLEFIQSIQREPSTVNRILYEVRGFFQFLIRQEILDENPLQDIPCIRERVFIPFVFSEHDTERLLCSVRERLRKTPEYFLKDFSVYMAILLQARCGLRISEPIHLLLSHYRANDRTIYIEKTKFKKDRLIPVPETLVMEINNYLALRNSSLQDDQNPYLLYGGKQRALSKDDIYPVFRQAVRDCGLYQKRMIIGNCIFGSPTTHSLRHSFAINTLKRIKEKGKSPQAALPVLAAYMGHCEYKYTAVYLKVLDAQKRKGLVEFSMSHQGKI
jgi:site-specific recombinase XerD